jgi:gluconate 2-dehydrogenase gamma chain
MADLQKAHRFLAESALNRRTFLKGSTGGAAFLAVQSALTLDASAQTAPLGEGLVFFDPWQGFTIQAMAERMWPATEDSPGATEAGVLFYIDRALAGPYHQYQVVYLNGIEGLDEVSNEEHGDAFRNLNEEQQDELMQGISAGNIVRSPISAMEDISEQQIMPAESGLDGEVAREVAGVMPPTIPDLEGFLNIVRTHTMQGLFADPVYGGNRDFAGWAAVGYPGPYYVYTEEEQQSFEPLDKPFQSIADFY